jgi:hypothetical protein
MKNFREIVEEIDAENEDWSREDLKELIDELDEEDISYVTSIIMDILAYEDGIDWDDLTDTDWSQYDFEEDDDLTEAELEERMTAAAKKKVALKRRKPAFKKAMRLKKKCMSKYGDKVRKSRGKANALVCGTDGKIKKGMGRADRRKLAKTRKRNKSKIIK